MAKRGLALLLAAAATGTQAAHAQPKVVFDGKQRGKLVLTTAGYRLTLSKANGGIFDLVDRSNGAHLTKGSKDGCLWGATASAATPNYIGGCSFGIGTGAHMTYRWDPTRSSLILSYGGTAAGALVHASVTLTAADHSFDLALSLENHTGAVVTSVPFPSDLVFRTSGIQAGYATTFLPGVKLLPGFFQRSDRVWTDEVFVYPSRWAWADYIALDEGGSHLAYYTVNPAPNPVRPVSLGFFRPAAPHACTSAFVCTIHVFQTWVPDGQTWQSPTVRFRVGGSARETILDYRTDNGIDRYPSLADKLGAAKLDTLARSPLIKTDVWQGLGRFADWSSILQRLPSPALLHVIAQQPGGFDTNDPDFLPPDPKWGTLGELQAAAADAHARGFLLLPYLNLSWWDGNSPTARGTPPAQYAVLDENGQPLTEDYPPHRGYLASPYAPLVRSRWAQTFDDWSGLGDCMFFDQIGARRPVPDFNPAAPNPLSYEDGWLSLAAPYANRCLMVEDGWDRLAQYYSGFHGSMLLKYRKPDELTIDWGDGNWKPYPLATWLLHDKVLMYQHDAFPETMTADLETLSWNFAFGLVLSYNLELAKGALESPWLDVVGQFQHALGGYYAGKPLAGFRDLTPDATETTFGDLTVTTNWSKTAGFMVGAYGLPPQGFVAAAKDSAVVAGAFAGTFNGVTLSPGTHYLVLQRDAASVTVRQPLGDPTPLAVDPPASWHAGQPLVAIASNASGTELDRQAVQVVDSKARFDWRVNGERPAYWRLSIG